MKYLLGLVFGFLVVASIAKADSVGFDNKKLTYELSARVIPLPNAQFPNGQPQGATITGTFTFSPKEFVEDSLTGDSVRLKSTLRFNPSPEIGGPSVPLVVDWFKSRFACAASGGCVPSMMLTEPGVGFAYLEFVGLDSPSGLPLQPVWRTRGNPSDGETEEFQLGGSSGFGEVQGTATLVTHKDSENLLAAQYSTSVATPEPSTGLLLLPVLVVLGLLLLRRPHP